MIIDFDSKNKGGGGKEPVVEQLSVIENGTYNAPSGVDGYNPVEVNVPQREPVLESLSVTDNGIYTPSAGVDGYNSVDVNVPKEIHNVTSKSITANGTYNSDGNDVWNEVSVNVPQKAFNKTSLTKEYTANGQYSIATPDGYDGISDVNLTVNVPSREPVLESLSITENGTYTPSSGVDGYNTVSVNVPQSGGTGFDFNQLYNVNFKTNRTTLDLTGLDTSTFTSMYGMFSECSSLTSLDLSHLDTRNVTNMGLMFYTCQNLASIDMSGWKTSNVTNMGSMFAYCDKLTSLDLSHFDTSNVTEIGSMFSGCSSLTSLDLSHFNTSKMTSMYYLFFGCSKLKSLNISNWDASKFGSMYYTFGSTYSLETINCNGLQLPDIDMSQIGLDNSTKLTVDSIVGLLNALPQSTNNYSFQIGQNNINKLSEEQKQIGISKGWTLI